MWMSLYGVYNYLIGICMELLTVTMEGYCLNNAHEVCMEIHSF